MTCQPALFDVLQSDLTGRLDRSHTGRSVRVWRLWINGLDHCSTAADVARTALAGRDRQSRRSLLAGLIDLAGHDPLAADTGFLIVLGDLRVVARQLARRWRAELAEIDQAVAVAGWCQLEGMRGRRFDWPDRMIVTAARNAARDGLRRQALMAAREPAVEEVDPGPDHTHGLDMAEEVIAAAVRRGVVSAESARTVWATRVVGIPASVIAGARGEHPNRVVMRRLRAEQALRRDRATVAGLGRAG